ncbi:MAG: hypothetical protein ABFC84_07205 [Veillonellales bacterium]
MNKKIVIAALTLSVILTVSTLAWVYYSDERPKKSPVRAKQVYNIQKLPVTIFSGIVC